VRGVFRLSAALTGPALLPSCPPALLPSCPPALLPSKFLSYSRTVRASLPVYSSFPDSV
jgi:hypothetical protein